MSDAIQAVPGYGTLPSKATEALTSTPQAAPSTTPQPGTSNPPPPALESEHYARLARVERKAREAREAAKAEQASVAAERAKLSADLKAKAEFEAARAKAAKDPAAWMQATGMTYDQLSEWMLNGGPVKVDPVAEVKEQLSDLQKQIEADKAKLAQEQLAESAAQVSAVIQGFNQEVAEHVASHPEKYELVNAYKQYGLVAQVVEERFKLTSRDGKPGVILSIDEAAEAVEEYLEEQLELATKTKKFGSKFSSKAAPTPAAPTVKVTTTPAKVRPVSNSDTTAPVTPVAQTRYEDKVERAKNILRDALRR